MKECANCGNLVTDQYAKVFSRREDGKVEVCPKCPDRIRKPDGGWRAPRSTRSNHNERVDLDRSEETKG